MDHSIAIPALVAFFITLILGPGLISFLHKLKFGQFISCLLYTSDAADD